MLIFIPKLTGKAAVYFVVAVLLGSLAGAGWIELIELVAERLNDSLEGS